MTKRPDSVARIEVVVRLPRDQVWAGLRDLERAHHYVPGLVATRITTPQPTGVGASRRVYRSRARTMDETVTEWEEGRGFLLRLHRGPDGPPAPLRRAWFRYRIERGDERKSIVSLALGYEMRWGALGRLLERMGLGFIVRKRVEKIAARFARYHETGSGESGATPHSTG